jgi:transposase
MPQPAAARPRTMDALERERAEERARADRLQQSLDQVVALAAQQSDELVALRKMFRRLEAQLAKVLAENRKLRRKLGLDDPDPEPQAAPVLSGDGPVVDPGGEGGAPKGAASPKLPGRGGKTRSKGDSPEPGDAPSRPRRVGGRRSPPEHLPADNEHHGVCACSSCGGRVLKRDVEETVVYTAVHSYVRRRIIRRDRVRCADPRCGAATTAPMPPMPCERALYDCSFLAWLVTMKFGYMMPLDRIAELLASQGVFIAMGTLVELIARAAELVDAIDGEHMKQLRAGKYMGFDGTGLKVLIPGQSEAWDGYLEVYVRDEVTVFLFDLTKHADELQDRLSGLTAVLVTDAESRNKAGAPNATFAHCNAHVVRAFREAERAQPVLAREGRSYLEAIYRVEREAQALGLVGDALRERRQSCRPILERFHAWLVEVAEGDLPPSDPVRKTARYYLRHWDGLTRFVDDPDLPLDNNAAEREFQRHAKLRLAALFAGSVEGAHRWATLLGVVRTAQKYKLDVKAYLTWVFERRGTHKARFGLRAKDLTPAAYVAAGCPGSHRAWEAAAAAK